MKKRYNLIGLLALALTAGITTSCSDFLTQENKKALTEEQIYSDVEFIELNLKGIYNTWRDNTRQDERAWFLMTVPTKSNGEPSRIKEAVKARQWTVTMLI